MIGREEARGGSVRNVSEIGIRSGIRRAVSGWLRCGREFVSRQPISSLATSGCLIAAISLALFLPASLHGAGIKQTRSTGKLDAVYRATLLGFPIGSITWTIEMRDDHFSASAIGSTAGLLWIFAQGHGTASVGGTVAGQRLLASNFMISLTHGSATEETKIAFSGGRARESLTPSPGPNPNVVPLTDAYRTGVLDPMTALLINVAGTGDTAVPAACERKIAVFDGRMRYDLRLAFRRIEQVRADTGYQGPAVVCGISFSPLAGYDPHRYAIKYLQAERNMEIWLTPLAGTRLLVPFRISVPTPIGVGILQATHFVWTRQAEVSSAVSAN
jgi:Protein of unknown function (DUF3108)